MEYSLKEISEENHRPDMPVSGWLVRYGLWKYGWKSQAVFNTKEEAETFIASLKSKA